MTRIKICGLRRVEDVELALELGVDAVGFVLEPTSPRFIDVDQRLDLLGVASRSPLTRTVAVFGPSPTERPEGFDWLQAIGSAPWIDAWVFRAPSREDPGWRAVPPTAKAIVLDAWSAHGYGGTGHQVDWTWAADVRAEAPVPVILAGGLTPDNVGQAIERVRPYAVDVSSGVEISPGIKDPARMTAFVAAVRASDKKTRER